MSGQAKPAATGTLAQRQVKPTPSRSVSHQPRSPHPKQPVTPPERSVYGSRLRVRDYAGRALKPVERAVVARLRPELARGRVLELGCGAGAITRILLDAGADVVGVDLSPAMVAHCRSEFPKGSFGVGDLRDLSAHPTGAYVVVVAGANVLDVASHAERPDVMAGIRRVIADDGSFYFSTHNRSSTEAQALARTGPQLRRETTVQQQVRAVAGFAIGKLNRRRLVRLQQYEDDYAILNDPAHRWGLLHHYITREAEEHELRSAGFELVDVWAENGDRLAPEDDDSGSQELHYLAKAVR